MLGKRVRRIVSKMQNNYKNNIGSYPRVDNDYSDKKIGYSPYPHPILMKSVPLRKKEYPFNKKTSLLELSNNGLLPPSLLFRKTKSYIPDMIETYFRDDMSIRANKKDELTRLINRYEYFLNSLEIDEDYLENILNIEKRERPTVELSIKEVTLKDIVYSSQYIKEKDVLREERSTSKEAALELLIGV